jgi:hypothetical protein
METIEVKLFRLRMEISVSTDDYGPNQNSLIPPRHEQKAGGRVDGESLLG